MNVGFHSFKYEIMIKLNYKCLNVYDKYFSIDSYTTCVIQGILFLFLLT